MVHATGSPQQLTASAGSQKARQKVLGVAQVKLSGCMMHARYVADNTDHLTIFVAYLT